MGDIKRQAKLIAAVVVLLWVASPCYATTTANNSLTGVEQRLVKFVHQVVATARHNSYELGGGHIDTKNGVYRVDCSRYVDHVLQAVYPHAYSILVNSTGSAKPSSYHYYDFFSRLPSVPKHYWSKVEKVKQLQPGDVLVFRTPRTAQTGPQGHVMIVMDKPVRHKKGYLVRVTDSAGVRHSRDTRSPRTSGIGIGTLLLKANPQTGGPDAYAWQLNSAWKFDTKVMMARPLVTSSMVHA